MVAHPIWGEGDQVLEGLKRQQADLFPNGMWFNNPCLESSLSMANTLQNMLIQSWSDPAKEESGLIRLFPALASDWEDIEFHDLRTEGAFLVSAKRTAGETEWVRIKSLAGEPCRLKTDMVNPIVADGTIEIKMIENGIFEI